MPYPDREEWNQLSITKQESLMLLLAKELPDSFVFQGIYPYELGTQKNSIALFSFENSSIFAFIPGGQVNLGYDLNRHWKPSPEELECWKYTMDEYEIEDTPLEYIAKVTLRSRTATIKPLLVETTAKEIGWQPIGFDDPDIKELLKQLSQEQEEAHTITSHRDRTIRLSRDRQDKLTAEVALDLTHESLLKNLEKTGFRFPSFDEWEYLCGSGAETLFRWGDRAPCDRYPTDISPAEARWRLEWVLSGGKLEYPASGFESDWTYHTRPNAFGLVIAENPYKNEIVSDPNLTRGGDGGVAICGGAGFFLAWLTLATAYFEKDTCEIDPDSGIDVGYTIGRRVLQLD